MPCTIFTTVLDGTWGWAEGVLHSFLETSYAELLYLSASAYANDFPRNYSIPTIYCTVLNIFIVNKEQGVGEGPMNARTSARSPEALSYGTIESNYAGT